MVRGLHTAAGSQQHMCILSRVVICELMHECLARPKSGPAPIDREEGGVLTAFVEARVAECVNK